MVHTGHRKQGLIMDVDPNEFKTRFNRFFDLFGNLADGYEKANPEWMPITYLQILRDALENLKRLIEDPEEKEITWENSGAELAYPIKANWEEAEPYYFDVTAEDLEDADKASKLLGEGLEICKRLYVLRKATREILIIKKGGKYFYKVPQALQDKLAKLSEEKQIARIEKILKPARRLKRAPGIEISIGEKTGRVILVYGIGPALIDIDKKEAHYPIAIGLEFKGIKVKDLGPGPVSEILDGILKELGKITPPEDLSFVKDLWPAHKADKAQAAAPLVKASLRVELQKWGHKPEPKQRGLFDALLDDTQKDITEKKIDVFGIDITQAQGLALHAIQALLTKTNYMGNIPGAEMIDQGFHFTGYLPALEFTPAEYLEAYGLTKYQTGRGKDEYSSAERKEALEALVDLAKKSFLYVYKRYYWKENEKTKQREQVIDRIETIAPLIKIMRGWEALTRAEDKGLDAGAATEKTDEKLTSIAIQPAPIMVQDINNLFVLKRANYAQEIKFLAPHASKFTYHLIDWLIAQAELKRRKKEALVITIGLEALAYNLRMEAYYKTRQIKRIRQTLAKSYKTAKDLGYLLGYSTIPGETMDLERLELNPAKYGVRAGKPEPELPKRGNN
jgi:hypothetical protein